MDAQVIAVACDGAHRFSKPNREAITLISGLGVADDAHAGVTVQHFPASDKIPLRRTFAKCT